MASLERSGHDQQTGLRPNWPKGRGIAEVCGFFANVSFLLGIGTFILGSIWPVMGETSLRELLIHFATGLALGAVWLALRHERLRLARAALIGNAALVALVLAMALWRVTSGQSTSSGDVWFRVSFLAFCGIIALFYWAQREVACEIERRKDHAPTVRA